MKKLIAVLAVLFSFMFADQYAWVSKEVANSALELIKDVDKLYRYCAPCNESLDSEHRIPPKLIFIKSPFIAHIQDDYYELSFQSTNSKPSYDLAYLYFYTKDEKWKNIAIEVGLTPDGVPKYIFDKKITAVLELEQKGLTRQEAEMNSIQSNKIGKNENNIKNNQNAQLELMGNIQEKKDEYGNIILSGEIKNIGYGRADFAKINITLRKNWGSGFIGTNWIRKRLKEYPEDIIINIDKLTYDVGDTVVMGKFKNKRVKVKSIETNEKGDLPHGDTETLTAFARGPYYTFKTGITSDSSILPGAVAEFKLVVPKSTGAFIGYSYTLDWEQYDQNSSITKSKIKDVSPTTSRMKPKIKNNKSTKNNNWYVSMMGFSAPGMNTETNEVNMIIRYKNIQIIRATFDQHYNHANSAFGSVSAVGFHKNIRKYKRFTSSYNVIFGEINYISSEDGNQSVILVDMNFELESNKLLGFGWRTKFGYRIQENRGIEHYSTLYNVLDVGGFYASFSILVLTFGT